MNKNYLIIAILAIIIAALCAGIAYMFFFSENTEYITTTIAESGTTLEIPDDMKVKSNESGITVLENDNTIIVIFNSADNGLGEIMAYAAVKSPVFGNSGNANITVSNPNIAGCSLEGECNAVITGNNETHDNIIVISKNKDITSHIINSIILGNKTVSSSDEVEAASSTQSSSSQPSAYTYKADGTPMYSQSEVDNYMLNKYGMVDYHVGDNGYIDMDEPGFDDAGNPI